MKKRRKLEKVAKIVLTIPVQKSSIGERVIEDDEVDATLSIDAESIIKQLAPKAGKSANWRASLLNGALVVHVRRTWVRKWTALR